MPTESKTSTTCGEPVCSLTSGSANYQGATTTNTDTGYIGDITNGNGLTTIPDYTITTTPYIANPGWISGTTSVGTYVSLPKDGTIRMDSDTMEFSIYLAETNEWVPCEVEEIKKEKDENGNIKNVIIVSFGCSVAYMKKKQQERVVMFEKVKKFDLSNLWGSTTVNGTGTVNSFIGYHTTPTSYINYIGGTDIGSSNITIGSVGTIFYDTTNYTTNITIDNTGNSIQIT